MDVDPRLLGIRQTSAQIALSLVMSGKFNLNDFHNLVNKVSDAIVMRSPKVKLSDEQVYI